MMSLNCTLLVDGCLAIFTLWVPTHSGPIGFVPPSHDVPTMQSFVGTHPCDLSHGTCSWQSQYEGVQIARYYSCWLCQRDLLMSDNGSNCEVLECLSAVTHQGQQILTYFGEIEQG